MVSLGISLKQLQRFASTLALQATPHIYSLLQENCFLMSKEDFKQPSTYPPPPLFNPIICTVVLVSFVLPPPPIPFYMFWLHFKLLRVFIFRFRNMMPYIMKPRLLIFNNAILANIILRIPYFNWRTVLQSNLKILISWFLFPQSLYF